MNYKRVFDLKTVNGILAKPKNGYIDFFLWLYWIYILVYGNVSLIYTE